MCPNGESACVHFRITVDTDIHEHIAKEQKRADLVDSDFQTCQEGTSSDNQASQSS